MDLIRALVLGLSAALVAGEGLASRQESWSQTMEIPVYNHVVRFHLPPGWRRTGESASSASYGATFWPGDKDAQSWTSQLSLRAFRRVDGLRNVESTSKEIREQYAARCLHEARILRSNTYRPGGAESDVFEIDCDSMLSRGSDKSHRETVFFAVLVGQPSLYVLSLTIRQSPDAEMNALAIDDFVSALALQVCSSNHPDVCTSLRPRY